MAGLLDELKSTLDEEYMYYEKLLESGNTKTNLIIHNKIEELNELNVKEQVMLSSYDKKRKNSR